MERSSTALNAKERKVSHSLIEYSGPISVLPISILENIILRLSIKRIFVCKCVCKTWCHLISDPVFAKLHFDQAQIYPLIGGSGDKYLSRMLYLVQPEPEDFEHKLDICDHFYDDDDDHECLCRVKVKLDTKFKLPLSNLHMLNFERGSQRNRCNMMLKTEDHKYRVVNSCNGLLCLSDQSNNDPVIVLNPITGEYINLPKNKTTKHPGLHHIDCGFGFSPATNQYKVIRMSLLMGQDEFRIKHTIVVADVHVLGTKSWKYIGYFCDSTRKLFPTNLNGCIHWFSESGLISFDIETERFGSVSLLPLKDNKEINNVAMGVLGGEICITKADYDIHCWVMNSAEKTWSKLFSFSLYITSHAWSHGPYQPIKYLNNGAVLLFHSGSNALLYKDPNKDGYKYLKFCEMEPILEAIPHIPSFVPLKDVLSGYDVEILNVKSRCAGLRLYKDDRTGSLVAKEYGNRF